MDRVEASPEIEAVFRRLMNAAFVRDSSAVHNLIARTVHVRMILTGAEEWWEGHDEVAGMLLVRFHESGIVRFDFDRIEGFDLGTVGLVAARVMNYATVGDPFPLRHSVVMILEEGTWRVSQWHVSSPTPNVEVFGHEMSKSLGDLVSSFDMERDSLAQISPSGTVTVMFTDLVDSTAVAERVGDSEWTLLVANHFEIVRQCVERFDGVLVKTLGDGTMAAFSSAGAAVEAAVQVQRAMVGSRLQVRIGLHSGDSQRREGDYYGISVNKAARIGSVAGAGEINASAVTAELASGRGIAFGPPRTVSLKGLDGTHVIRQIEWTSNKPAQE
jgi:class 3 adenylate cyclase